MQPNKLFHLECARGIASVAVIFHHFVLAFLPGLKAPFWKGGLQLTPLYLPINGQASVTFFFILSGFVLSYRFYLEPSPQRLTFSVLKRFPRLWAPATLSLLAGLLVVLHAGDWHLDVSEVSGSKWLQHFAYANFPENFTPSLRDALEQSFRLFFLEGQEYYNSNLWTMRIEFFGSLIVFALLYMVMLFKLRHPGFITAAHGVLILAFAVVMPHFVAFTLGSLIAYWRSRVNFVALASPLILAGFLVIAGVSFMVSIWPATTVGSFFLLLYLLSSRKAHERLSGPVGEWLGKFSFPLYLVHTLIILSLSSFVYLQLINAGLPLALVLGLTLMATLIAATICAVPFVFFDQYWVKGLNRLFRGFANQTSSVFHRLSMRT